MAMEGLYVHIANKLESVRFGLNGYKYKLFDSHELKSVQLWRAVFCEFIGSVVFVFLGCSAAIGERLNGPADYVDLLRVSDFLLLFTFLMHEECMFNDTPARKFIANRVCKIY